MDFALTSGQQMVAEAVRDFVERELYPHEERVERSGRAPPEPGKRKRSTRLIVFRDERKAKPVERP